MGEPQHGQVYSLNREMTSAGPMAVSGQPNRPLGRIKHSQVTARTIRFLEDVQVWRYTPVVPALERLKQQEHFKPTSSV